MEDVLSALAFAGVIAAQFLAVMAVHEARRDPPPSPRRRFAHDPRAELTWHCGS